MGVSSSILFMVSSSKATPVSFFGFRDVYCFAYSLPGILLPDEVITIISPFSTVVATTGSEIGEVFCGFGGCLLNGLYSVGWTSDLYVFALSSSASAFCSPLTAALSGYIFSGLILRLSSTLPVYVWNPCSHALYMVYASFFFNTGGLSLENVVNLTSFPSTGLIMCPYCAVPEGSLTSLSLIHI